MKSSPESRVVFSPRRIASLGLIFAAMLASGCGPNKEKIALKEKYKEQKQEQKLEKIFNPYLAKIGRKAVRFAKSHPYTSGIYDVGAGQKQIDIDVGDTYEIGISLKKGTDTKDIESGDVTGLLITKTNPGRNDTEVRIESPEEDPFSKNPVFSASTEGPYEKNDTIQHKSEDWHITTSPYGGVLLNDYLEPSLQDLTPADAAHRIINSANHHFERATRATK